MPNKIKLKIEKLKKLKKKNQAMPISGLYLKTWIHSPLWSGRIQTPRKTFNDPVTTMQ